MDVILSTPCRNQTVYVLIMKRLKHFMDFQYMTARDKLAQSYFFSMFKVSTVLVVIVVSLSYIIIWEMKLLT